MPKKKKLTQNKELLTEVGLKFISILNKQLPDEKKITEEQLKERLNNQTLFDQASKYQEAIDKQVSLKAIDSALRKEEHIDGHNMVSGISRLISHKMKIADTPEAKEYNKGLLQDCFNKDKVGEYVSDALKFAYTIDYTALGKATDEEKIDFYTKNEDKIMILHSIKSIADSADIQVPPQMKQDFLDNVPIFEALNDIEVIRANKTKTVNFFIPEDLTLSNEQIEAMMPELMQAMSEIPQSKFDEQDTEPYQGMDVFNELQSRNSVHSETTQFIYEEMAKGNISSLMTSKNYYLNGEPVNISTAAKNKNEIQMSSKNMDVQKAIKSSLDGRMALSTDDMEKACNDFCSKENVQKYKDMLKKLKKTHSFFSRDPKEFKNMESKLTTLVNTMDNNKKVNTKNTEELSKQFQDLSNQIKAVQEASEAYTISQYELVSETGKPMDKKTQQQMNIAADIHAELSWNEIDESLKNHITEQRELLNLSEAMERADAGPGSPEQAKTKTREEDRTLHNGSHDREEEKETPIDEVGLEV